MSVTELDVRKQVRRLLAAFSTPKPEDEIVAAWMQWVAPDVENHELMAAVSEYGKSPSRYMPTPGQIRELALKARADTHAVRLEPSDWNQLQEGPCPVCGAVLQLAHDPHGSGQVYDPRAGRWRDRTDDDPEPPMRYRVLHDGWTHKERGIPAVGDVVWPAARISRTA